ncbi:hypothetical protein OsJ_24082 [Oryza sativa Japonica Group]|uniref:Uncharacterized protein n=1 Tax=Oryza sativa subsp. japonica TaxID=39947 RepID=B9FX07_ORYSJ|nr:hypothetical protein OsJ_24082 [Oryza sativa Japonica Group]
MAGKMKQQLGGEMEIDQLRVRDDLEEEEEDEMSWMARKLFLYNVTIGLKFYEKHNLASQEVCSTKSEYNMMVLFESSEDEDKDKDEMFHAKRDINNV